MNDSINTGDYGQFSAAINRVGELNTQLEGYKTTISGYENTINNQDVFAGPLADSAIQAFTKLNTMISSSVANFSTIKGYVNSALTNYQNADSNAVKYLDIKDGKIVESASAPSTVSSPTQLTGNTNRDKIYNYLTGMGFSSAGAAAVMGNLRQESGFSANNVQDGMGYSDEDYVVDIKSGKISREEFMNDGRGFGIAQWTYPARKAKLYDKLGAQNIDSLEGQLDFMYNEMGEDLRNSMKTADDVNSATTKFHNVYERSADTSMSGRQSFAREVYDAYNA